MPTIKAPGRYSAKVIDASLGESSTEKRTPFVSLYLETEEGAHIGAWLYLSEAAFNRSLETMQKCFAFDGDFENVRALVGKPCSIVVEEENDDKGKPQMRVKWINPIGGGAKPAPEGLAAKLTQRAKAMGATPAAKQAAPAGKSDNPW